MLIGFPPSQARVLVETNIRIAKEIVEPVKKEIMAFVKKEAEINRSEAKGQGQHLSAGLLLLMVYTFTRGLVFSPV